MEEGFNELIDLAEKMRHPFSNMVHQEVAVIKQIDTDELNQKVSYHYCV